MVMSYCFVVISLTVSFIVQIIIYRWLKKKHIRSMASALAYIIGLVFLVYLAIVRLLPLPMVFLLLFVVSSIGAIWSSFGMFLGGETPSLKIFASYRKKRGQTEQELRRLFTDRNLVGKRIDDLVSFGYIEKHKNRFVISQKGKPIVGCMQVYLKLFSRRETG